MQSVDFLSFIAVNYKEYLEEGFVKYVNELGCDATDEVCRIRDMQPGDMITWGGGAAATTSLRCVSAE